jgi:predicted nucleotidyltransferase
MIWNPILIDLVVSLLQEITPRKFFSMKKDLQENFGPPVSLENVKDDHSHICIHDKMLSNSELNLNKVRKTIHGMARK